MSGVIVEVKMDELCTTTVMRAPMMMAKYPVSQGTYGMSELRVILMTWAMLPVYIKRGTEIDDSRR